MQLFTSIRSQTCLLLHKMKNVCQSSLINDDKCMAFIMAGIVFMRVDVWAGPLIILYTPYAAKSHLIWKGLAICLATSVRVSGIQESHHPEIFCFHTTVTERAVCKPGESVKAETCFNMLSYITYQKQCLYCLILARIRADLFLY